MYTRIVLVNIYRHCFIAMGIGQFIQAELVSNVFYNDSVMKYMRLNDELSNLVRLYCDNNQLMIWI